MHGSCLVDLTPSARGASVPYHIRAGGGSLQTHRSTSESSPDHQGPRGDQTFLPRMTTARESRLAVDQGQAWMLKSPPLVVGRMQALWREAGRGEALETSSQGLAPMVGVSLTGRGEAR